MAPSKSLPQSKVDLVRAFFTTTRVAYTLKDLEKQLPSAAGISSMTVKDYINHLTGESQLSVEKIGSGNWYWSFPADAKAGKKRELRAATAERDKVKAQLEEVQRALEMEGGVGEEQAGMVGRLQLLRDRREALGAEVKGRNGVVREGALRDLVERTNAVIDNLEILESWIEKVVQDPEKMRNLKEMLGLPEEWEQVEYVG